jgi:hypothetical protein
MEGHVVQAPNSYLNTLFILNMRRSGGLAEAVPVVIAFGTTIDQIEGLRNSLLEFVKSEKREYQPQILTELREVTEAYSLTLNVVFFYKSNWQNELLRLQRRNKFISALMMAMQELGIEGPRKNQAGWRSDSPYYMQMPPNMTQREPSGSIGYGNDGPRERNGTITEEPILQTPAVGAPSRASALRRTPSTGQLGRPRGESISAMARRVDFSLGMRDIGPGSLSDAVEDPRQERDYRNIIREANRADEQRKSSLSIDREGTGRTTSRDDNRPNRSMTGILRRSTTQSFAGVHGPGDHRPSISSTETHRNRFLSRLGGRNGRSMDLHRDSLAEEGQAPAIQNVRLDPRTGHVGSQAVRTDSNVSSEPFPAIGPASTDSRVEDFELTRLARNR